MSFEAKLNQGIFCIPKCDKCKKIVWPVSEFCDQCFGGVSVYEVDYDGRIIEFSSKNERYFCIVEIEKTFRIIATSLETPEIGQSVKITKCGISQGSYFFDIS